jgi:hypothetical protein
MLLAMAEAKNRVDEIINSPEMKPTRPVINNIPIRISLLN